MAGQSFGARMAAIRASKAAASGVKVPAFVKSSAVKSVTAPAKPVQRNASKPMLPDAVVQDIKNSPKGVIPKSVQKYTSAKNGKTIMPAVPKTDKPSK